jgi:hypothetical protein
LRSLVSAAAPAGRSSGGLASTALSAVLGSCTTAAVCGYGQTQRMTLRWQTSLGSVVLRRCCSLRRQQQCARKPQVRCCGSSGYLSSRQPLHVFFINAAQHDACMLLVSSCPGGCSALAV